MNLAKKKLYRFENCRQNFAIYMQFKLNNISEEIS